MFPLDISCLTTFNLPWFIDLTFHAPMQYCSLQHHTLHPSPVTSTTERCFWFGTISSIFLKLFLHSSPVAYWHLPIWGVHLSVSYLFAFSYCSWGSHEEWVSRCSSWFRKGRGTRDQIDNIRWIIEAPKSTEKHIFLLYWLCQSLWLYGPPQIVENSERDGNTRPPDLPLETSVCRSGSNS